MEFSGSNGDCPSEKSYELEEKNQTIFDKQAKLKKTLERKKHDFLYGWVELFSFISDFERSEIESKRFPGERQPWRAAGKQEIEYMAAAFFEISLSDRLQKFKKESY